MITRLPIEDNTDELRAWRLKLIHAEANQSLSAAVLCRRRIDYLLDQRIELSR